MIQAREEGEREREREGEHDTGNEKDAKRWSHTQYCIYLVFEGSTLQ